MTSPAPTLATPPAVAAATCEFLRRYAPFNRMRDETLRSLVPKLKLAYFAKDATILSTQSGPVAHLHIIERGLVGSRPNNTQADPDRTLGPGELFPGRRAVGGRDDDQDLPRAAGHVLLPARARGFPANCGANRRSSNATARRRSPRRSSSRSRASTASTASGPPSSRSLTRTLAELVRNAPVACAATATLREAAQKMADAKVRTIIVVDDAGAPVGHVHAGRPAAARPAARAPAHDTGRRGDDGADRDAAGLRHRVRGDARRWPSAGSGRSSSSRTAGCSA